MIGQELKCLLPCKLDAGPPIDHHHQKNKSHPLSTYPPAGGIWLTLTKLAVVIYEALMATIVNIPGQVIMSNADVQLCSYLRNIRTEHGIKFYRLSTLDGVSVNIVRIHSTT